MWSCRFCFIPLEFRKVSGKLLYEFLLYASVIYLQLRNRFTGVTRNIFVRDIERPATKKHPFPRFKPVENIGDNGKLHIHPVPVHVFRLAVGIFVLTDNRPDDLHFMRGIFLHCGQLAFIEKLLHAFGGCLFAHEVPHLIPEDRNHPRVKIALAMFELERVDVPHHGQQGVAHQFLCVFPADVEYFDGLANKALLVRIDKMRTAVPVAVLQLVDEFSVRAGSHTFLQ